MSFPDLDSLRRAASDWKFRKPRIDETEAEFRAALADHVHPRDIIEAHEIRTGVGHNEWTKEQKDELVRLTIAWRVRQGF